MNERDEPAGRWRALLPWLYRHRSHLVVAIAVLYGLVVLWPQVGVKQYVNDSAIHASMVRWAAGRISAGHLPFDGWYPSLSLGASRFHHYQALPAITTGGLSTIFGPGVFSWTLYLLLATWPISVYLGARMMGIEKMPAATAALFSPLIVSAPSLGYEYHSYIWRGWGLWTQLWGMWLLPIALGASWRAITQRRAFSLAAVTLGFLICAHLLTGYLAMLALGVWVLMGAGSFARRVGRAAVVAIGALALSAWMIVPLLTDAAWAPRDELAVGTSIYDSYGVGKVLGWLFRGQLFDLGRLPILTLLFGCGVVVAARRARHDPTMRAILGLALLSFLLFFGRSAVGPVLQLLPGGHDIFLRRFIIGVHMAGLWLVGVGGWWLAEQTGGLLRRWLERVEYPLSARRLGFAVGATVSVLAVVVATTASVTITAQTQLDAERIAEQHATDIGLGAEFASLVTIAITAGDGRIFVPEQLDPVTEYKINRMPAHIELLNHDAQIFGFQRPAWSLLSGVERLFNPTLASQYDLFDVRYVILPIDRPSKVPATELARTATDVLWEIPTTGYLEVVNTQGTVTATRDDLARQVAPLMSVDAGQGQPLPTLAFGGEPAAPGTLPVGTVVEGPPGRVNSSKADPANGIFSASITADRPAAILLKQTFDPRWVATVDGASAPVIMLVPGMPGVVVSAGAHEVRFEYQPYPNYGWLFLVGLIALVLLAAWDLRSRRRAPGLGLEPRTYGLTVRRSTN